MGRQLVVANGLLHLLALDVRLHSDERCVVTQLVRLVVGAHQQGNDLVKASVEDLLSGVEIYLAQPVTPVHRPPPCCDLFDDRHHSAGIGHQRAEDRAVEPERLRLEKGELR